MVLGVFGDWGSGKTSFLRQLQFLLTYDAPLDQVAEAVRDSKRRRPSETRARASQATDGKAHGTAFVPRRLV